MTSTAPELETLRAVLRRHLPPGGYRAFLFGWIDDDRLWLDMLEDRGRASHSYREATADRIRDRLPAYATALRAPLLVLGQQP